MQKSRKQEISIVAEILDKNHGYGFLVSANPRKIRLGIVEAMFTKLTQSPQWETQLFETLADK